MKKMITAMAVTGGLAIGAAAGVSATDHDLVVVSGDTVDTTVEHERDLAPDGTGWWFERDLNNVTGHTFTADGIVTDVGGEHGEKFIAENFLFQRVSDVGEISFDYTSDEADSEFYINVYVNHEEAPSGEWYDCVYNYVTVTQNHGVKSINTSGDANKVVSRPGTSCPASLAGSPYDSFVRAYSINVGGTSPLDLEPATIISSTAAGTTYLFQAEMPDDISDCKDGGYADFEFRNQGQCVASIKANEKANKG